MEVNEPADAKRRSTVGQLIRIGRSIRDLTIEQAAAKAEISQPTWGGVERGHTARSTTYHAIGRALGLDRPEIVHEALTDDWQLGRLQSEMQTPWPDLTKVPHGALLAEIGRRLSSPDPD